MTISSLTATSTTSLMSRLEANGLSASSAQLVQDDLSQVEASQGENPSSSNAVDMETMRAALDQKIDDDVASGKLSQSDADAVKKTLDEMDGQTDGTSAASQTSTTASTQSDGADATAASDESSGASGGGGGGSGGSSSKTEVSETVTVSGPLKTTVVTYSDGSTQRTTSVATDADEQKYGKQQAAQSAASASATALKYLSTLAPGTMFDKMA